LTEVDRQSLLPHARDALGKLYQPSLLQIHPLSELLLPEVGAAERGAALKELLLDAMQRLRPPHTASYDSPRWRRYRSLFQFYLEGKGFDAISRDQGVSERQARRDLHQAIDELGDFLWARYCQVQPEPARAASSLGVPSAPTPDEGNADLEVEIERIGSLPPEAPLRVDVALRDVIGLAGQVAERLRVRIVATVDDSLPTVAVNQAALRSVLFSVLGWALDTSDGGDVTVNAIRTPSGVEISIQVPGALNKRAHDAEDGLRLGQHLLEKQGGRLDVLSIADGSCLIRLGLPSNELPTILVVDDNPDVLRLFQRYIRSSAVHLVQAITADQALQLVKTVHPSLITLDLMMPLRDGWDLLHLLKRDPSTETVPIAVCSVVHERALALAMGASYFLPKPINRDALLDVLDQCGLRPVDDVQTTPQTAH
jgi:CheY-like chemotaxis protein